MRLVADKADISLRCPWCNVASRVEPKHWHQAPALKEFYFFVVCPVRECDRAVLIVVEDTNHLFSRKLAVEKGTVYPDSTVQYAPEGVPEQIAEEFGEALACAASGRYLGAALVGRRVLQAAARQMISGEFRSLEAEIDAIPDDRLNVALKRQAHQVRLIGNDAAHADAVGADDVDDLLGFVGQVLDALYVAPHKVAKLEAKRAAAKAAEAAAKGAKSKSTDPKPVK